MKKDRLYLYIVVTVSIIALVVGFFTVRLFVDVSTNKIFEVQINSSKREAIEFSKLISFQLENNIAKDSLVINIQKSIENTNLETGFICMLDWSGILVCHPDPKQIGKESASNSSFVQSVKKELSSDDFDKLLHKEKNGEVNSEIIYLHPVKNSDWIIAASVNISVIQNQINQLKQRIVFIHTISSFLIILSILLLIRFFNKSYVKAIEEKNEILIDKVLELSKMNTNLVTDTKKAKTDNIKSDSKSIPKNRIITYLRNQIITIDIKDIAFVNIENTITTVTNLKGIKHTSNSNLEDLYNSFDKTQFFRVNRQYIVSINAIDQILRYGNSQLKITTKPVSETDIIISKNKAASFKKWLNK